MIYLTLQGQGQRAAAVSASVTREPIRPRDAEPIRPRVAGANPRYRRMAAT